MSANFSSFTTNSHVFIQTYSNLPPFYNKFNRTSLQCKRAVAKTLYNAYAVIDKTPQGFKIAKQSIEDDYNRYHLFEVYPSTTLRVLQKLLRLRVT